MKTNLLKKMISTFLSALICLTFTSISQCAETVPAGTLVPLSTVAPLNPELVAMGDTVMFVVARDVVVNSKVVIKAGATARGEVTASKNNNLIGIAGKMGIAAKSVEAVDGSTIMLTGSKNVDGKDKMVVSIGLSLICCVLFALMKGGDAEIPAGSELFAQSLTSVNVNVK